jgi:acetoin utilization protein AcuB
MTPFPWFVEASAPLVRAQELLSDHGIRHLPVTRGGELVGIVAARDIELAVSISADGAGWEVLTVKDISTLEPYVVDMAEPLDRVLDTMAERRLSAALVTRQGRLAGILTATDGCRGFSEFLRAMFPEGPDDEAA